MAKWHRTPVAIYVDKHHKALAKKVLRLLTERAKKVSEAFAVVPLGKAEWDESLHPRNELGEFTEAGGSPLLDDIIEQSSSISNSFTGEVRYQYFATRGFSAEEFDKYNAMLTEHSRDHTQEVADKAIQAAVDGGDSRYLEFLQARADAEEYLAAKFQAKMPEMLAEQKEKEKAEFLRDVELGYANYSPEYDGPDPAKFWEETKGYQYTFDKERDGPLNRVVYRKGDATKTVLSTSTNSSGANTQIYSENSAHIVPDHSWRVRDLMRDGYRLVAGMSGLYGYVGEDEVLFIRLPRRRVEKADLTQEDRAILNRMLAELDIEGISVDMVDSITPEMIRAFKEAGIFGVAQVGLASGAFEHSINKAAMDFAEARGAELIKDFADTTRDALSSAISKGIEDGISSDQLAGRIQELGAFGGARASTIARTELAFAFTQGNVQGWRETGVVQGKQWLLGDLHAIDDECDDCADAGIIPFDDEFIDGIAWPPAHPNCVCACIPITEMPDGSSSTDEEGDSDV